MDKQLGSGNFGEVFLGKLIGAITTPGVGTYIGTRSVAVKLLKSKILASVYMFSIIFSYLLTHYMAFDLLCVVTVTLLNQF